MQYSVNPEINCLSFLKILGHKFDLYLVGDFEIEPFTKWSIEFAAEYWFLKYTILKEKEVKLNVSENNFKHLCIEKKLNIIWITITDKENFKLKCIDGNWQIEILNPTFDRLEELIIFSK